MDLAERLRKAMSYDGDTGSFVNLVRRGNLSAGANPGCLKRGYVFISFEYRIYPATHLVWLYVYGFLPTHSIDHIDGDTQNNRLTNLREATKGQNNRNKGASSRNKLGVKGVSLLPSGKYQARIGRVGVRLGNFDTIEEAAAAYRQAELSLYGEFAFNARAALSKAPSIK